MTMPLDGIRVIDWTIWQQGPVASAMLADLGADVIKVEERTGGDPGRGMLRSAGLDLSGVPNFYFEANNRNKRSLTVDLKKPEGIAIVRRLAERADSITRQPSAANALAVANPIPRLEPVTRATLPVRLRSMTPAPSTLYSTAHIVRPFDDRAVIERRVVEAAGWKGHGVVSVRSPGNELVQQRAMTPGPTPR